ncbi:MAG: sensor domain-containing diguanylate cyclase [Dokdonella sp.]|uniref:sensor domain-containing diguanylate cyclase n=1 Tax=Dokdonella sp. TaxID=2291710 RepID=UPI003F81EE81
MALVLLCSGIGAAAHEAPMHVERREPDLPRSSAARIVAGAEEARFVAESYAAITPSREHGQWYRIRLASDWMDARPPVLTISDPQGLAVVAYLPPAYAGVERSVYRADGGGEFTRHAISIVLPDDLRADQPVYLWIDPASSVPRRLMISDMAQARTRDIVNARLDILFPAIQLATLLVMLSFFIVLRERMYAYFVGQMLFIVLFEFYEFGVGFEYPPLAWLAPFGIRATWLMSLLAAMLSIDFTRQFLDLAHAAPRIDRVLARASWPLLALALIVLAPWTGPAGWLEDVLAFAFLLLAPLLLVSGLAAWQQGGHRGGYYLCAWVPGLLFVIVRSLQLALHWPEPVWLEFALPAAFAFAGIVLAFGLADHIVSIRDERDLAHRLAEHDMLTGVLNRRAILARLRSAFLAAREKERPLAVLFLDLDHFKRVNDSYGHRAGDQCLRAVIAPIATELRQGDALGRYGGEEFLVVLPGATVANAEGVAERIRRRVEEMPMLISGTRVGLTLSIGVAVLEPEVLTPDDLIERADAALYLSKSGGRNLVSTHRGALAPLAETAHDVGQGE